MAVSAPPAPPSAATRLRVPWTRTRVVMTGVVVVFTAALVWSWRTIEFGFGALLGGAGDVANLLGRMLPPRFVDLPYIIELAFLTLAMAVVGTALAIVLSVPVAVLAARNTTINRATYYAARGVIVLARAVPDVILAVIFVRGLGIGVLPGILAIGLHSIGMIGKLFADAIEQVDEGAREAVAATGGGRLQDLATAVFPQVLPSFIGTSVYRLDINLRTSTILGVVGAGGIGFELQDALRSLSYDRGLGIVIVIFVLILLVELVSSAMRASLIGNESTVLGAATRRRTLGDLLLARRRPRARGRDDVTAFDRTAVRPPWTRQRIVRTAYLVGTLVVLGWSVWAADANPVDIAGAVPDMWQTFTQFVPPDFTTARSDIIEGMLETIAIGVVATAIGALLAVPFGFLAARNVAPARWVMYAARTFLVFERGIPELILAVIFVAAVGLGPVGGTMALALGSLGLMAKLMADNLEEVDPGPREAVVAAGATRGQETAASLVPQAMPSFVGSFLYLLDVNIRSATILGIVGGGGIGFLLFNALRTLNFATASAIVITIFAVVYAIEQLSGWVRAQLR
jgi:phosphonate transport system permease protein